MTTTKPTASASALELARTAAMAAHLGETVAYPSGIHIDDNHRDAECRRSGAWAAVATAEALDRIAGSLERIVQEMDEDAEAIRSLRTTD